MPLGAEINAETERQTARDSTDGRLEALGNRGVAVADTRPEGFAKDGSGQSN